VSRRCARATVTMEAEHHTGNVAGSAQFPRGFFQDHVLGERLYISNLDFIVFMIFRSLCCCCREIS
jgi:hypothetical protein